MGNCIHQRNYQSSRDIQGLIPQCNGRASVFFEWKYFYRIHSWENGRVQNPKVIECQRRSSKFRKWLLPELWMAGLYIFTVAEQFPKPIMNQILFICNMQRQGGNEQIFNIYLEFWQYQRDEPNCCWHLGKEEEDKVVQNKMN